MVFGPPARRDLHQQVEGTASATKSQPSFFPGSRWPGFASRRPHNEHVRTRTTVFRLSSKTFCLFQSWLQDCWTKFSPRVEFPRTCIFCWRQERRKAKAFWILGDSTYSQLTHHPTVLLLTIRYKGPKFFTYRSVRFS